MFLCVLAMGALFQTVGIYCNMPCPSTFLFLLCIWRDFKYKSGVCHVLYEELFMLDGTHSQVDVETEFGAVSPILLFYKFYLR